MGSIGKKNPSQRVNSIKPLNGVSVRVTTQAKKIAIMAVITISYSSQSKGIEESHGKSAITKSIKPSFEAPYSWLARSG